jgi:dynein heavy chain
MKAKSQAAGYMTLWLVNLVRFNTIYKKVKPLMDQSEAAQAMADAKSKELEIVQEKVRQITEKVDGLQKQLDEAVAKKNAVV